MEKSWGFRIAMVLNTEWLEAQEPENLEDQAWGQTEKWWPLGMSQNKGQAKNGNLCHKVVRHTHTIPYLSWVLTPYLFPKKPLGSTGACASLQLRLVRGAAVWGLLAKTYNWRFRWEVKTCFFHFFTLSSFFFFFLLWTDLGCKVDLSKWLVVLNPASSWLTKSYDIWTNPLLAGFPPKFSGLRTVGRFAWGDYPQIMRQRLQQRLPRFSEVEKTLLTPGTLGLRTLVV